MYKRQGIHYSFIASVAAMLISLIIFFVSQKTFPTPAKKIAAQNVSYTPEEKAAMAKEIKQRMYALFAVLGLSLIHISILNADPYDSIIRRKNVEAPFCKC